MRRVNRVKVEVIIDTNKGIEKESFLFGGERDFDSVEDLLEAVREYVECRLED